MNRKQQFVITLIFISFFLCEYHFLDIIIENENQINLFNFTNNKPEKKIKAHIFYYLWYGNITHDDGKWIHWNHRILPYWKESERKNFPHDINYEPPEDFGASFSPFSLYSNNDAAYVKYSLQRLKE